LFQLSILIDYKNYFKKIFSPESTAYFF